MSFAIFAMIMFSLSHAWERFRESRAPTSFCWKLIAYIDYPAALVRDAIVERFGRTDRVWLDCASTDSYKRGDLRITQVPNPRSVRFADIPSLLSVGVATVKGRTEVTVQIDIGSAVGMRRSAAKHFEGAAEGELSAAVEQLKQAAARLQHQRDTYQEQREHRRERAASTPSTSDSDYELLGLKRGASLEQVQKAYRIACRQYHPDRLTGQNVEPHLVELAVQRFKEVAAAYQRIKESLPQGQHA